jgi:hypothetical protein
MTGSIWATPVSKNAEAAPGAMQYRQVVFPPVPRGLPRPQ